MSEQKYMKVKAESLQTVLNFFNQCIYIPSVRISEVSSVLSLILDAEEVKETKDGGKDGV